MDGGWFSGKNNNQISEVYSQHQTKSQHRPGQLQSSAPRDHDVPKAEVYEVQGQLLEVHPTANHKLLQYKIPVKVASPSASIEQLYYEYSKEEIRLEAYHLLRQNNGAGRKGGLDESLRVVRDEEGLIKKEERGHAEAGRNGGVQSQIGNIFAKNQEVIQKIGLNIAANTLQNRDQPLKSPFERLLSNQSKKAEVTRVEPTNTNIMSIFGNNSNALKKGSNPFEAASSKPSSATQGTFLIGVNSSIKTTEIKPKSSYQQFVDIAGLRQQPQQTLSPFQTGPPQALPSIPEQQSTSHLAQAQTQTQRQINQPVVSELTRDLAAMQYGPQQQQQSIDISALRDLNRQVTFGKPQTEQLSTTPYNPQPQSSIPEPSSSSSLSSRTQPTHKPQDLRLLQVANQQLAAYIRTRQAKQSDFLTLDYNPGLHPEQYNYVQMDIETTVYADEDGEGTETDVVVVEDIDGDDIVEEEGGGSRRERVFSAEYSGLDLMRHMKWARSNPKKTTFFCPFHRCSFQMSYYPYFWPNHPYLRPIYQQILSLIAEMNLPFTAKSVRHPDDYKRFYSFSDSFLNSVQNGDIPIERQQRQQFNRTLYLQSIFKDLHEQASRRWEGMLEELDYRVDQLYRIELNYAELGRKKVKPNVEEDYVAEKEGKDADLFLLGKVPVFDIESIHPDDGPYVMCKRNYHSPPVRIAVSLLHQTPANLTIDYPSLTAYFLWHCHSIITQQLDYNLADGQYNQNLHLFLILRQEWNKVRADFFARNILDCVVGRAVVEDEKEKIKTRRRVERELQEGEERARRKEAYLEGMREIERERRKSQDELKEISRRQFEFDKQRCQSQRVKRSSNGRKGERQAPSLFQKIVSYFFPS